MLLPLAMLLLGAQSPQQPSPTGATPAPAWTHANLPSGPRVSVLHDAAATTQVTFTWLPLGLLRDGAGAAQSSHLIEHALLRGVDPESLQVDGIRINGETQGGSVRLESIAPAGRAAASLQRHGRWLRVRELAPAVLAREKTAIAGEVQSTTASGFVHKWALAAFGQALHHGRDEAAILGDVVATTPEQLAGRLQAEVPRDASVWIVTRGPLPAADALAAIAGSLGDEPPAPVEAPAHAAPAKLPESIRWDLPRAHLLVWFPLPADARLAGFALAQLLQPRFLVDIELTRRGARAFVNVEEPAPGRPILLLSASLGKAEDAAAVRDRLVALCRRPELDADALELPLDRLAAAFPAIPLVPAGAMRGFGTDPELAAANVLLQQAQAAYATGLPIDALGDALGAIEPDAVVALWRGAVLESEPQSLRVLPR